MNLVVGVIGFIVSLIPLMILPFKIKTGRLQYIILYIFLVLYYLSLILYSLWPEDYSLLFVYLFEMLFFLNMYRAYLKKELFFSIPAVLYFNDLAIIFTFYFVTFNLFELGRAKLKEEKVSSIVLSSLIFFELGVVIQIMEIFTSQNYVSLWATVPLLIGAILFIVPALRVAYEKEKV